MFEEAVKGKGNGKGRPKIGHEGPERGQRYSSTILNLGAGWGGWLTPPPGCFTPGKDPVPTAWETGWAPSPLWTGVENLATPLLGFDPRTAQPVANRYNE